MRISPADLMTEWRRAVASWPFLADVEVTYRLPRCLLVAVGSRETNCTNEVGDGAHGHGVWQYDDRSHTIPAGFDSDVRAQADMAAKMLRGLIDGFQGNIRAALDAYNAGAGAVRNALAAGRDPDSVTTGRDYGADVLERMSYLQTATNPSPSPPLPTFPVSEVTIDMSTLHSQFFPAPGVTAEGVGWFPNPLPIPFDKISGSPIIQAGDPTRGELPFAAASVELSNNSGNTVVTYHKLSAGTAPGFTIRWFD